jgi:peptide chain release factor 1
MYVRYSNKVGWKVKQIDSNIIQISGFDVFNQLKLETGTHRVQRIPLTEKRGRLQTSTASVVVLQQITSSDVVIRSEDLDFQACRAGGNGGQNVNKVSTAVRITHRPSGIVVSARQERSQAQNREVAMNVLKAKLWQIEEDKKNSQGNKTRSQSGRSRRADKIRTYNYPRNQVKDHRINKSFNNLDKIMQGHLEDLFLELSVLENTQN